MSGLASTYSADFFSSSYRALWFSVFVVPRSPFYNPSLARFVDAKYGPATLETFLVRLKPLLLFGLVSLLGGVVQTWVCYDSGNTLSQGMGSLSISAGFALLLAHAILRYRGVKGV
jgi:hypothetical protein